MSPRKTKPAPPPKKDWLEIAKGKVGQITALIGALVALIVGIQQLWEKLVPPPPPPKGSCVQIDPLDIPQVIAYSEWDNEGITITGRNDCNRELGLYVTFTHRVSDDPPRFVLRRPHDGDYPECTGAAALGQPKCWDAQKPVAINQGLWKWEAPLPPLSKLGEPRRTEMLGVTWDVRDFDAPDKAPLATTSVAIKIIDDTGTSLDN